MYTHTHSAGAESKLLMATTLLLVNALYTHRTKSTVGRRETQFMSGLNQAESSSTCDTNQAHTVECT
jgi:hypothetical protein